MVDVNPGGDVNGGVGAGRADDSEDWSEFGAVLTEELKVAHVTQREFAIRLGTSTTRVNTIARGKRGPKDKEEVRTMEAILAINGPLLSAYSRCRRAQRAEVKDMELVHRVLRPFLIQIEIRLSSLHRIATGLLGGAALMILLPLFYPEAPAQLLTALFTTWPARPVSTVCVGLALGIVFGAPLWGFILIVGDLAGFFFTAHRFGAGDGVVRVEPAGADGDAKARGDGPAVDRSADDAVRREDEVFNPRLGLTGLRLSEDVLPVWVYREITEYYKDHLRILIPDDARWRENFNNRMISIFRIPRSRHQLTDEDRLSYALRLAVSRSWPIVSEAAKMELSLAKHILLIRIAILRFLKSLLLVPSTVLAALLATSLLTADTETGGQLSAHPHRVLVQLVGVLLLWGPAAVTAVGAPARWIFRQSPGTGRVDDIYKDPRMVRFEGGVVFLALVSAVLLVVAGLAADFSGRHLVAFAVSAGLALVAWVVTLTLGWRGRLVDTPKAFWRMLSVGRGN